MFLSARHPPLQSTPIQTHTQTYIRMYVCTYVLKQYLCYEFLDSPNNLTTDLAGCFQSHGGATYLRLCIQSHLGNFHSSLIYSFFSNFQKKKYVESM